MILGQSESSCDKAESGRGCAGGRGLIVETTVSWYTKGPSVLVLGTFVGYVLGFISCSKKAAASEATGLDD